MDKNSPSIWTKRKHTGKLLKKEIAAAKRRAERREHQEQKILKAAAPLFWEKGYLGTSLDDIAKKGNILKGSILYYFKNKTLLLYEVISFPLKIMIETAKPIANSDLDPLKKLESLITNHIKWQLNHLGLTGIGHIERKNLPLKLRRRYISMRDSYELLFKKVIEEGIKKEQFTFADVKLGTLFVLGMLTSITQWYKPKGKYSVDEIASKACNFILAAMRSGKAGKTSSDR